MINDLINKNTLQQLKKKINNDKINNDKDMNNNKKTDCKTIYNALKIFLDKEILNNNRSYSNNIFGNDFYFKHYDNNLDRLKSCNYDLTNISNECSQILKHPTNISMHETGNRGYFVASIEK